MSSFNNEVCSLVKAMCLCRWLSAMSAAVASAKKQPIQISDIGSQITVPPPIDEIMADSVLDVTDSIDQCVVMVSFVSCYCLCFLQNLLHKDG